MRISQTSNAIVQNLILDNGVKLAHVINFHVFLELVVPSWGKATNVKNVQQDTKVMERTVSLFSLTVSTSNSLLLRLN